MAILRLHEDSPSVNMNLLESQVTDLNYLAESPLARVPTGSLDMPTQQQQQQQPLSSPGADSPASQGGTKRKADDTSGNATTIAAVAHTRAKRNRYISIACNECKRRKIKCNGNTPCQRCGNLNLECQYAPNCCSNGFKDSEEFRRMNNQLSSLQEQVDNLYASLNALRADDGGVTLPTPAELARRSVSISHQPPPLPPHSLPLPGLGTSSGSESRYRLAPKQPPYRGPTSSTFSLDVGKNTLHSMGYQGLGEGSDEGPLTQNVTPLGSPSPLPPVQQGPSLRDMNDPLFLVTKEEMVRLCRVYEEEMGIMYPVLDIEDVIMYGMSLYDFILAALRSGLATPKHAYGCNDPKSCLLKMVLACASIVEGSGKSDIGYHLFDSIREITSDLLQNEAIGVRSLPLLTLVAIFHFHCDEEALAWRIIGQVARMCVELGLHRRESLYKIIPDEAERASVIKMFWSIYVLDRRWSFGTGMPFALQDPDIDPALPEPDSSVPYLNAMIAYSRIGSKVWRSICGFSPSPSLSLNIEEIGYLDYQILQWQKSIPLELQLPTASSPLTSSRAAHRLQILLYLRCNQMRILIYRPVLHTALSIQENIRYASTVVELAKDTIRALTHLNQTTDIYRVQQVCFNYFLIQALAVLFLASCHAPVHFSALCRDEFYMALDLVKGFSNKSFVSKRLWRTIKGLKEVGPKLGLAPSHLSTNPSTITNSSASTQPDDPHSSAALAMAGLAGHEISDWGGSTANGNGNNSNSNTMATNGTHHSSRAMPGTDSSPIDGYQMSHEMTNLFEAALGSVTSWKDGNGGNGNPAGGGGYLALQPTGPDGNGSGANSGDMIVSGSHAFGGDEELYRQLRDLF